MAGSNKFLSGDKELSHPPSSRITILCSSFKLGLVEQELLEKGLNFIPTPRSFNKIKLHKDLYDSIDHFNFDQNYNSVPFKNPSTWEPNSNMISLPIQDLIKSEIQIFETFRVPSAKVKCNITRDQRKALTALKKLDKIIIKPADKGGQIVLQDRIDYVFEANRQLQDSKYYVPLAHSMQTETQTLVQSLVNKLYDQKFVTFKQLNYLYGPENPHPRLFYLLSKIHKPPESWTVPFKIPAGRPLVSDCGSESYRIAEYIDYYINPLARLHACYIKDTYDFVVKLRNLKVPKETLLFSIDVESLYTNTDTERGIRAIKLALQRSPQLKRPEEFILEPLKLTLTRNDFDSMGHFLQISGCAMGQKYSPAYADIYMADWERSAYEKCTKQPLLYLRYLDDIFGHWVGTEASFKEFFTTLNEHHPKIKLKYNLQKEQVEFLDTLVFFTSSYGNTEKGLTTKVYFKPMDRHALLHKRSYVIHHFC